MKTPKVAYFCMEYGLDTKLPIYAGGLGILAGDYLKTAKENNLPVVGIGILWSQDYTTQLIGEDGYPYDVYPQFDYDDLVEDTGVAVEVEIAGEKVKCKVWKVDKFDNAPLYLLDTNYTQNKHSWITQKLYGGSDYDRVAQEIVLGIGGIRALRALGIDVDLYHLNEGHAVFAGFELIKEKMEKGISFEEAVELTKKEIVFTTHTPVEAGNEVHNMNLLFDLGANNGLDYNQLRSLGGDPFNMTVAALRLSYRANAVSQLHGETARSMWNDVEGAAPIVAITNGVHEKTWQNKAIREVFENENKDLWKIHLKLKQKLLDFIQGEQGARLDPNVLTIGFARRAAAYKRGGLIFKRQDLLEPLLKEGKLQLVYSGKAHPNDHAGKSIIKQIVSVSKKFPNRVVYLENYDMDIGRLMVQGCDVWLNNPLRPMEASGTSGMKAAYNGILNVSVVDGWVAEAVTHRETGWLLDKVFDTPLKEHKQDEYDADAFFEVLLKEIIPIYYEDKPRWIKMMKASIKMAHEKLSAQKMIKEYYNKLYNKAFSAKTETPLHAD